MENQLVSLLKSSEEIIREEYGLDLTWGEKVRLKAYIESFIPLYEKKIIKEEAHGAAIHLFMLDTFGLDTVTIRGFNKSEYNPYNPEELMLWLEDTGIKRAQFREYCRTNVQNWRAEREHL